HWGLAIDDTAQVRAQLYYPLAQVPDRLLRRWSELMSIAVRTSVNPSNLVVPLRSELRGAAGDQVLYEINTMEQLARSTLDRQRFLLLLFGVFAGLSLLLACIGVYGVLSYLTNQRVPEIGVRLALGATAGDVTRTVLRESLGMVGLGVAAGASVAIAAAHILVRMVDGMQPADPSTFVMMISVLVGAALLASFVPARRASRIDPTTALRED
ncbi:MAG TPA: FtsX-like permease family protein, partial [Blastocatellia bacterium]|nr:FtsX-like permease family protein [Blastocatellia bacterium]